MQSNAVQMRTEEGCAETFTRWAPMGMVVSSTGDGLGMARCCREVVRSLELACAISRTRRRRLRRATRGQSAMRCGTIGMQLLLQFMACVRWHGVRASSRGKTRPFAPD